MKILIIQLARFGDLMQTVPLLRKIKTVYPKAEVSLFVDSPLVPLAEMLNLQDKIYSLDIKAILNNRLGMIDGYIFLKNLLADFAYKKFDIIINLNYSPISAILCRLADSAQTGGFYYDKSLTEIEGKGEFRRLIETSINRKKECSNLSDIFKSALWEDIIFQDEIHPNSFRNISVSPQKRDKPLILIQTGAGNSLREWPEEYFAGIIDGIYEKYSVSPILIGIGKEAVRGGKIAELCKYKPENLIGKTTLPELANFIADADLLITPDTGSMHLAACMGINIIAAFWGSANGFETGPYTRNAYILQYEPSCFPCKESEKPCAQTCKKAITPAILLDLLNKIDITSPFSSQNIITSDNLNNIKLYKPIFTENGRIKLNKGEGGNFL